MSKISAHIEWVIFLTGIILLALMDPLTNGISLCLIEAMGVPYCPGEGLGHSVSYVFRGEISEAFQANIMGPIAVLILGARILTIWKDLWKQKMDANNQDE